MPAWFDEFAAAIAADTQQYLSCAACGEATVPPRQCCPACGAPDLDQAPLSSRGSIVSYTEIFVTIPKFHGETPYTIVLAEFPEGVRLTGQLRGASAEEIGLGDEVDLDVEPREEAVPVITFHPVGE